MFRNTIRPQFLLKRPAFHNPFKTKKAFQIFVSSSYSSQYLFKTFFSHSRIPIHYSFSSSSSKSSNVDLKDELTLLTDLSQEQLAETTKIMEKYTQCFDVNLLAPNEAQTISQVLFKLANAHKNQGNYDKALRYFRENEEFCQKSGLKDSYDLARSYLSHADLDIFQENWTEAEHYLNEVQRICKLLGEDEKAQSLMLEGLVLLSVVYYRTNLRDKCLEVCNCIEQTDVKIWVSPDVPITVYSIMGDIYESRHGNDKAIEFYAKRLQTATEFLLENPEHAFKYSFPLTQLLYRHGPRRPETLKYTKSTLEMALKAFAKNSYEVAFSRKMLGTVYLAHQNTPKALDLFKEALKFYEKSPKDMMNDLEDLYLQFVKAYIIHGDAKKARDFLAKVDQLVATSVKEEEVLAQRDFNNGEMLRWFRNMAQESQTYFSKALERYKRLEPRNNAMIFETSLILGRFAFDREDWNKAYELWKESEKCLDEIQIDSHVVSTLNNNLGSVCTFLGNLEEAEKYFLKAVQMEETVPFLKSLAVNYDQRGMVKEALEAYKKVVKCYEKSSNRDYWKT